MTDEPITDQNTEGTTKTDTEVRKDSPPQPSPPPQSKAKTESKSKVKVRKVTLLRVDLPKHTHEQTWKANVTTKPCPECDAPMRHQSMPCKSGVKECCVPQCGWKCIPCDQYYIEG